MRLTLDDPEPVSYAHLGWIVAGCLVVEAAVLAGIIYWNLT